MIELYKVANDGTMLTYSMLTSLVPFRTMVTGDILTLEVSGTTLNVYFNRSFFLTTTDATYSTGQPGLGSFAATNISSSFQAATMPARN